MHEDDQLYAIGKFYRWVHEALDFNSISRKDYRWSPAGDGGYLSFVSPASCRKAIDVAFSIFEKFRRPDWRPRTGERMMIRAALHSGTLREGQELDQDTNIWGMGINMTARILSVSAPSQLLVSKQYFDTYIGKERLHDFEIGEVHWRTVKHGMQVEVLNVNQNGVCLAEDQAYRLRWRYIGGLWRKTIEEYQLLIRDTMMSADPVAAIAAAKFLIDLGEKEAVSKLCEMISLTGPRRSSTYTHTKDDYPSQSHPVFSLMPPDLLLRVIEHIKPRIFSPGEVICREGDCAESCFFPISGTMVVDVPGREQPIPVARGQIVGEFSLWIPNLSRTATLRTLDAGLLMELRHEHFGETLKRSPDTANGVYGIIKRRIVENILDSDLFPGIAKELKEHLAHDVTCEKFPVGTELDLTSTAYVLFRGKVRIHPPKGSQLDVLGTGHFRPLHVVGIVSTIGSLDGKDAFVVEETVAVRISHELLHDLQRRFSPMDNAWNALYGLRLGEIQRKSAAAAGN